MKEVNQKKLGYNLQFFADDNADNGDNSGDDGDDNQDDEEENSDKGKKSDKNAKKYTQEEIDDIITKRLKRERDKQKKQEKSKEDDQGDKGADDKSKKTDDKVSALEAKLLCFEHDVSKDSVSDVVALAKSYVDEDTDFEEAIEKVVKKYPQFVKGAKKKGSDDDEEEEETNNGSWGQRQKGQSKKTDGVEAAFLKKNPGIKID